jgi:hypothetical protein
MDLNLGQQVLDFLAEKGERINAGDTGAVVQDWEGR